MSSAATEVLDAAMRLSTEERAEVVTALIQTLDDGSDPDVEEAWAVEIQRRLREVEDGTVELLDLEAVRQEIQAKLSGR